LENVHKELDSKLIGDGELRCRKCADADEREDQGEPEFEFCCQKRTGEEMYKFGGKSGKAKHKSLDWKNNPEAIVWSVSTWGRPSDEIEHNQ
jgi:hypothetical protein